MAGDVRQAPHNDQTLELQVLEGDGMSADDAAWASIADAAGAALKLPGLSPASRSDLREVQAGACLAAGLPSRPET